MEIACHSFTYVTEVRCIIVINKSQNVDRGSLRIYSIELLCSIRHVTGEAVEYGIISHSANDDLRLGAVKQFVQPWIVRRLHFAIGNQILPINYPEVWCFTLLCLCVLEPADYQVPRS
ncbi:hypothetical protein IP70_05665 [alpha proteobacterium AAP38]|nr:hypothetical protein IP70_05665 [alpha proteobacterium AAP38]